MRRKERQQYILKCLRRGDIIWAGHGVPAAGCPNDWAAYLDAGKRTFRRTTLERMVAEGLLVEHKKMKPRLHTALSLVVMETTWTEPMNAATKRAHKRIWEDDGSTIKGMTQ